MHIEMCHSYKNSCKVSVQSSLFEIDEVRRLFFFILNILLNKIKITPTESIAKTIWEFAKTYTFVVAKT